MKRLVLVGTVVFLSMILAACGSSARINTNFDDADTVPDYLRADDLLIGIAEDTFSVKVLRLLVQQQGRGESGRAFIMPAGDATPENGAIEVKLRIQQLGSVGLWLRGAVEEPCSGYGFIIDPTRDTFRLAIRTPDCDIENLDTRTRLAIDLDTWYTLRFEADGNTLRALVDGVEFFSIEDETHSAGLSFIELTTAGELPAQVEIDQLIIE